MTLRVDGNIEGNIEANTWRESSCQGGCHGRSAMREEETKVVELFSKEANQ